MNFCQNSVAFFYYDRMNFNDWNELVCFDSNVIRVFHVLSNFYHQLEVKMTSKIGNNCDKMILMAKYIKTSGITNVTMDNFAEIFKAMKFSNIFREGRRKRPYYYTELYEIVRRSRNRLLKSGIAQLEITGDLLADDIFETHCNKLKLNISISRFFITIIKKT